MSNFQFNGYKANPNVTIPVYNELCGQHKVINSRIVITTDSENLVNVPTDVIVRDWNNPNPCVYVMFQNDFGVFHHRYYGYGFYKWDEVKMDPKWNDKMDFIRVSTAGGNKPYAIWNGSQPINCVLNIPGCEPETYTVEYGGRIPSERATAYARSLYDIFCLVSGMPGCDNPENLVGRELYVDIREHYWNGKSKRFLKQISATPFTSGESTQMNVIARPFANPKAFGEQVSNDPLDV